MIPKLQKKFDSLERSTNELINKLQAHTHKELNKPLEPNKWSAAQHLEHILLVEKASIGYIAKKINVSDDLNDTGLKNKWRFSLMKLFFAFPFKKIKAPAIVANVPDESDLVSIESRWKQERKGFIEILSLVDQQMLPKELFKHPFAGKLNLIQTLEFLTAHLNHHKKIVYKHL